MPEFLVLDGRASSLVLELVPGGAPLWRHWGARLPHGTLPHAALTERPRPSFATDEDVPFSVFPTFGLGWFEQSALLAHRDGRDFAQAFTRCDATLDGQRIELTLTDDVAAIAVLLTLELDPETDVLTLASRLTNTGTGPLDVQWLAAGVLPLPGHAARVRHSTGRHNSEFVPCDDPLGRGLWRRENRRGLTSHDAFPGAVVLGTGGAWGAQLAWSGNHAQTIEWIDDGRFQWQAGEWFAPGEIRLGAGESIDSPPWLATFAADADGVAQNFHAAVRRRGAWPDGRMRPRPVHLNTWEALYFDHRLDDLKALADAAASIGIERFVLDDGWFAGRDDDTRALGDWRPDAGKYPDGLTPLAAHVTGLGMEFGLWVEPEMVNPDSDLFRAHPDWALQVAGRPHRTARNQLVLDLANPAVAESLAETLGALLRALPVSYLKWDHNRDLLAASNADGQPRYRAQVLANYALIDRLRAMFPQVEIESCAGGGGRIDAGIATRTHRFWTSDTTDAVARTGIQRGFLQFMPPERMGAHVGSVPAHTTGRSQALGFRAAVALPGHFGVELDPRTLEEGERAELRLWIARYKALRDRLHSGGVWQGDAGDGVVWQAHGDATALVLLVYRLTPPAWRYPPSVALTMLDPARRYDVNRIDRSEAFEAEGGWLSAQGIALPAMKAEAAAIYRIDAKI